MKQSITRRELLAALGIGGVGLVLAACGGSATSTSSPAPASASPSAAAPASSSAASASAAAGGSALASAGGSAAARASGSASASGSAAASAAPSGSASGAPAASGSAAPVGSVAPAPVSADLQPLIDAAKKEGQVTLYSIADPSILAKVQVAFQTGYGVTLNFQRLVDAQLAQRYGAEAAAGNVQADVIGVGDPLFMDQAIAKGWIAKIDSLPALANWPKDYWTGQYARLGVGAVGMAWNTKIVSSPPTDWTDALKPEYKGKLVMADPRTAAANMAWVYVMRQFYGDQFLKGLAAQNPLWTQSVVPGAQSVASGASSLQLPAIHPVILALEGSGAPIKDMFPTKTTGVETMGAISAKAPHPNAAKLLLNYMMTPEGQTVMNKDSGSPLPNIPGTIPLPSGYVSPPIKEAAAAADQLVALLGLK